MPEFYFINSLDCGEYVKDLQAGGIPDCQPEDKKKTINCQPDDIPNLKAISCPLTRKFVPDSPLPVAHPIVSVAEFLDPTPLGRVTKHPTIHSGARDWQRSDR